MRRGDPGTATRRPLLSGGWGARLALLTALNLSACFSSGQPIKHTPARATVFVQITETEALLNTRTTDPGLRDRQLRLRMHNALGMTLGLGANGEAMAVESEARPSASGDTLAERLREAFARHRIAKPVHDVTQADLVLRGVIHDAGQRLMWRLIDRGDEKVVHRGDEASSTRSRSRAIGVFAAQITERLRQDNLDVFEGTRQNAVALAHAPGALRIHAPSSKTDGANAFALIIGVERYREALPPATHAEADAKAFAAYVKGTLGVPEAQTRLLIGDRAGQADIQSMLREWLPRNARRPGGKVYVFFSGHGAPDPATGETYLVPWDGDPAYLKTRGIGLRAMYEALDALADQQVHVFLDACFSGGGGRSVLAPGTRPLVPIKTASPGRIIAFAAAGTKETTGMAPGVGLGLFTRHLLAALGGAADTDGDRNVSLGELARYVKTQVSRQARLDNRDQTPVLQAAGVDPDQVILVDSLNQ